jgi:hypothetical protein
VFDGAFLDHALQHIMAIGEDHLFRAGLIIAAAQKFPGKRHECGRA